MNRWEVKKIKDIALVTAGQSPEGKYYNENSVGLPFYQGKKEFTEKYIGEPKVWTTFITKEAIEGDVLMSVRAPVGPVNFATQKCCIGRGLASIRVKEKFDKDFLFLFFKNIENQLTGNAGAVFNSINKSQIENIAIPIPPLEEQRTIVAKLDQAFAAIDQAKANIEKNIANAKELFQSKLVDLFQNYDKTKFEVKTIKEITSLLGDGLHGTPKYNDNGEYYFINGNNLMDEGIVIKPNTKRIDESQYLKYKKDLNENTVLVSINGTLGNVGFYNNEKVVLGKSACYFNLKKDYDKRYIMYQIKSPIFLKYAHKEATGATIKNVSLKSMRNFEVIIPKDQKIQNQIVVQLDQLQEQTNLLVTKYQQKLTNLEELKKSILEKAFKGELV